MEFVGSMFTSLFSGGSAAAGAGAAGSAGTAATGAASGGLGLGALNTASTVLSVVAGIGSGMAADDQAQAAAEEQEFASREEYIRGKETSAALKQELLRTISDQQVAFAAGGVDLGSVSVQQAKSQAIEDAEDELDVSSSQSLSRSLARRRQAANLRSRGRNALFQSVVGAGQAIVDNRIDQARLGTLPAA